ncbi:RNHCP domain-containing protein [Nesterenkonia pannonica]|uniref:RNHCP domain-containing protein n=1 Tax=Nesterenkonia pannonica TaxID=1548602 RepID=UPI002164E1B2|nr:RNHCP domain-containing protein [Nesterenkonia pannonica]
MGLYAPGSRGEENTGFACVRCGELIPAHPRGSYRNHCPRCLWSRHVDVFLGDRAAHCLGPMRPVAVDYSGKKGYVLIHRCTVCAAEDRNRVAPDDDFDAVVELQRPSG